MAEGVALLEVLARRVVRRRRWNGAVVDHLAEVGWLIRAARSGEWALQERHVGELVARLDRLWPGWRAVREALESRGLEPTPRGVARLREEARGERIEAAPERMNRRTAASLLAAHSKATLTAALEEALAHPELTHDNVVRVRPCAGMVLRRGGVTVSCDAVTAALGEVALPDRAFRGGLRIEGALPRAVLTIENAGAFVDLPRPEGWLYAFVPGWNVALVPALLGLLEGVPCWHFGDLDPNGVRIFRALRERQPALRWFAPAHWEALAATHGQPCEWPAGVLPDDGPEWIRRLVASGRKLEQEPLVVAPATVAALSQLLEDA